MLPHPAWTHSVGRRGSFFFPMHEATTFYTRQVVHGAAQAAGAVLLTKELLLAECPLGARHMCAD